jgi:hypothetical protein
LEEKNIYLKLIDRAGNESLLYDNNGDIKSNFTDSISISDLMDLSSTSLYNLACNL